MVSREGMEEVKVCWVCTSTKFVDAHHYDCREGAISSDTVPLCRRCHRTYHDRGIEWFEGKYLDRVLKIENKRRLITSWPAVLLRREDIVRSAYWYETHPKERIVLRRVVKDSCQLALPF